MSAKVLQGTLFGGFKRKDVIAFIEKSSREHNELLAAKEEALEKLRREMEQLRQEKETVLREAEALRADAEEYRSLKGRLADLQIEAMRRADEIETAAHERAEKTEAVAYSRIRAVTRESKTRFDESFAFVDDLLNAADSKAAEVSE